MNSFILMSNALDRFESSLNWLRFKYWLRENIVIIILVVIVIIGIIVISVAINNNNKRNRYYNSSEHNSALKSIADEKERNRLLREGGWECQKCGKVNPKYQTSCVCGQSRATNDAVQQNKNTDDIKQQLKAYKQMLDEGLITQEEFDAKRKSILKI